MYYVYEWFIVETGEVIYVGKGIRNRYRCRKHNKFFNDMIRRTKCDSRIVKYFEREEDAFAYEFEHINEMRAIGQCVCNIYDGGCGGSTKWWTDEIRKKYSEMNVMKSQQSRERMSRNNPMKNPEIAKKTNGKKQKAVIIDGIEYESVKAVCEKFHVAIATVELWCFKGHMPDGRDCYFKGNAKGDDYVHVNDGQKMRVIYKGQTYESATDMARAIGIGQPTASRWCRQGFDSYGNECRYENDTRKVLPTRNQKSIPVIVNDVWYPNKEAARKVLGLTAYTLTQYLDGKKTSTEFTCRYAK